MQYLWMTIHAKHGSISWRGRTKWSNGSALSKPWLKIKQGRRSKYWGSIIGPNMKQMNSMTIVERLALRGRPLLHIILRKMDLPQDRINQSYKLPVICFMTNAYRSSYGENLPTLSYMFKIDAHVKHWTSRHPKKFSPIRNSMFPILEFLVVPCIFMCWKRKEQARCIWEERNICGL